MEIDLKPTKAGIAHIVRLFKETLASEESKIEDAEKRLEKESDPLLIDALEALITQEAIRAGHMRSALVNLENGE